MEKKKNQEHLSSVTNALRILKSFSSASPVRRVSDLANELNVSKSTISRLIKTLVAEGFLKKDDKTAGYRLGYANLTLGGMLATTSELYQEVAPVLNDVVLQIGESAHVAVLEGANVIYLNKNQGPYYSNIETQVGHYNPAHATSSGKVLMAYRDEQSIDDLFSEGVEAFTENTIVNPIKFRNELAKVRQQGYAISIEERTEDNFSIAAPVRNIDGEVVCAIVVVGPLTRMKTDKLDNYVRLLLTASKEASERLGYEV